MIKSRGVVAEVPEDEEADANAAGIPEDEEADSKAAETLENADADAEAAGTPEHATPAFAPAALFAAACTDPNDNMIIRIKIVSETGLFFKANPYVHTFSGNLFYLNKYTEILLQQSYIGFTFLCHLEGTESPAPKAG